MTHACAVTADGKPFLKLVPANRPVTIRDLLRHTSGITYEYIGSDLITSAYTDANLFAGNVDNKLFAVGTYHYPYLAPYIDKVASQAKVQLLKGHDRPDEPRSDDWTEDSDHIWFHRAKIPFIYFGVEDYEQHHKTTDDFDTITPVFFTHAIETVVDAVKIPRIGPSLGGVESLIEQPYVMSYFEYSAEDRRRFGIPDNMIRLSCGIENTEDLIADLAQALERRT